MNSTIKILIGLILLVLTFGFFLKETDALGGTGTINQLEQWKKVGNYITQNIASTTLKLTGYESGGDCLVTDANGIVSTAPCGTGSATNFWTYLTGFLSPATTTDAVRANNFVATSTATNTMPVFYSSTSTVTNMNILSRLAINGDISLANQFYDTASSSGSNGQVLTSTGTSTLWKTFTSGASNWTYNGSRLSPSTTVGIGVFASSTIGGGTGATGLTINGGATTTGNLQVGNYFTNQNGALNVNGAVFSASGFSIPGLTTLSLQSLYSAQTNFSIRGWDGAVQKDAMVLQNQGNANLAVNFPNTNVGIGTSTPASKLSIQGTAGSTTPLFTVASSTQQSLLTVLHNGNVGVGTTTFNVASTKLAVGGGISIPTNSNIIFNAGVGGNASMGYDGAAFRFDRGSGIIFRINGSNAVIGADAFGSAKLSVNGNGAFGSTYYATSAPTNGLIVEGNVGIGTTTPSNKLTIAGALGFFGTIPTLSSCGTSPSIVKGSTDSAGEITQGSVSTGCTITFSSAKTYAPFCTVTAQSGLGFSYTISTSAITITNIGALSSTKLNYKCIANNN